MTEEPVPPDFAKLRTEGEIPWSLEWSVAPRKLAGLYLEHAWAVQVGDRIGIPTPAGLATHIATNVGALAGDDEAGAIESGRLLFVKDDGWPDTIHVYVHVGTASRAYAEDEGDVPGGED